MNMSRCFWCNEKNPKYVLYHDNEWGCFNLKDSYVFEMLLLESFQAGLSFQCVLNKREDFKKAFDHFNYKKIAQYPEEKIQILMESPCIIRNSRKIKGAIKNAGVFINILREFGSFENYLRTFWDGKIIYEVGKSYSLLSEQISKDLSNRGMTFVGKTIIYSLLQALGVIYSHERNCFLFKDS